MAFKAIDNSIVWLHCGTEVAGDSKVFVEVISLRYLFCHSHLLSVRVRVRVRVGLKPRLECSLCLVYVQKVQEHTHVGAHVNPLHVCYMFDMFDMCICTRVNQSSYMQSSLNATVVLLSPTSWTKLRSRQHGPFA